jgi:MFS family permease
VPHMQLVLFVGVMAFAILFAINSSIHSYLVLRYAEGDKVSQSVGFYYMANAGGRLTGTLLSGWIYTYVGGSFSTSGMACCFIAGAVFSLLAVFVSAFLRLRACVRACVRESCVRAWERGKDVWMGLPYTRAGLRVQRRAKVETEDA